MNPNWVVEVGNWLFTLTRLDLHKNKYLSVQNKWNNDDGHKNQIIVNLKKVVNFYANYINIAVFLKEKKCSEGYDLVKVY